MTDGEDRLKDLIESIKQQRDELAVQIHLGKKEAQEEWQRLEKKWQELRARSKPVMDAVEESGEEVGSALELVGEELKKGYRRIKKLLED